jgi:hypothetical protein
LYGVNNKPAAFSSIRLREIFAIELEKEGEAVFGGDESYSGGK